MIPLVRRKIVQFHSAICHAVEDVTPIKPVSVNQSIESAVIWIVSLNLIHIHLDEDNEDEKSRPSRHDRRRIRTPFCDDNAVQFAVSASSSEKAENSDIFTVSSDSFLDADVNDTVTVTTAKSRLSADSCISAEDDGSMSDETTGHHETTGWRCRSSLRKLTFIRLTICDKLSIILY